ncbi:hypothetical protein VNI00_001382 [Paramarasmius palmivorus]|uniref:Uncharacterized protein n=1 Tax=Paramarasmius palmivorus TaxID=297713 RepID=A0AAW0E9H1_9AGAR
MGGGFIYFGATALGEQATRLMFGDELFDLLLTDEPANWPGLPRFFVPLVAARFMTRTFSNIISLAGMYIMWPKVPPPAVQEKLLANSNRIDRIVPDYRPRTSTSWPPRIAQFGGIVAATSIVYSLLFNKFRRWVLDLPRQVERPTRRRRRRGHRIAGNLNLNLGRDGNRRRQAQAGAPAPEPDVDDDDDDEDPRIVRLEGITRISI